MKMKKVLLATACAAALVVGSVAGTMAYLTSQDEVVNTFTVGDIVITLDEANVDNDAYDGKTPERDKANDYKLIPGSSYEKDPTVHFAGTNEPSYVFVEVENGIAAIEAPTVEGGYTAIADQIVNVYGWTALEGVEGVDNVYYKTVTSSTDLDLVVFNGFTLADGIDNETLAAYEKAKIAVTAYAIQQAGFEGDVAGAWKAGNWS